MKSTLLKHKIRPPSNVMHRGANTASSVLIKISSCFSPQILQTGLVSDCIMVELFESELVNQGTTCLIHLANQRADKLSCPSRITLICTIVIQILWNWIIILVFT